MWYISLIVVVDDNEALSCCYGLLKDILLTIWFVYGQLRERELNDARWCYLASQVLAQDYRVNEVNRMLSVLLSDTETLWTVEETELTARVGEVTKVVKMVVGRMTDVLTLASEFDDARCQWMSFTWDEDGRRDELFRKVVGEPNTKANLTIKK